MGENLVCRIHRVRTLVKITGQFCSYLLRLVNHEVSVVDTAVKDTVSCFSVADILTHEIEMWIHLDHLLEKSIVMLYTVATTVLRIEVLKVLQPSPCLHHVVDALRQLAIVVKTPVVIAELLHECLGILRGRTRRHPDLVFGCSFLAFSNL